MSNANSEFMGILRCVCVCVWGDGGVDTFHTIFEAVFAREMDWQRWTYVHGSNPVTFLFWGYCFPMCRITNGVHTEIR